LEVRIHGPDNYYLRQRLLPLCRGPVRYVGFLSAVQVSPSLLDADLCFLSLASDDYGYAVPGKLYEYIAHARPILAALPDGPARTLIESEGFGLVARCGDPVDLALQLEAILDRGRREACHQRLLARRNAYAARPHFLSLAQRLGQLGEGS
jgi:glycosyltransferase involved in cell wall biosynthesis